MKRFSEAQLQEIRDRHPVDEVAAKYVTLRRTGRKLIGPCPVCSLRPGSKSATRFEIADGRWTCATCEDGGDVLQLVMKAEGLDLRGAVAHLGGARQVDPEEAVRREAERAREREAREREADQFREKERSKVFGIWQRGEALAGSPAAEYLALRLGGAVPAGLNFRCIREMPFYASGAKDAEVLARSPAMLAPMVRPDGKFGGVHITYVDLANAKGKLALRAPETGDALPARKVRGSKKGARIELATCAAPHTLVLGEGIEKTAAVLLALRELGRDISGWAFWTSVDLGNLGGRSTETVPHPTARTDAGRVQRVAGPSPDMASPAIPIPDSVQRLVLLGDSTSDRFSTECTLVRAAERYAMQGRDIVIAWAPPGVDFDDVRREATSLAEANELIALALDAAAPARSPADMLGECEDASARRHGAQGSKPAGRRKPAGADHSSSANDAPPPDERDYTGPDGAASATPSPAAGPPADDTTLPSGEPSQKRESRGSSASGGGRKGRGRGWDERPKDEDGVNLQLARYPLTDLGNAERFAVRWRGRLLYCPAMGWLYWDRRRWSRQGADAKVQQAVHLTVRAIFREAEALIESGEDEVFDVIERKGQEDQVVMVSDRLKAWARKSEDASRLAPIAKHGQAYLQVEAHELDADPFMLNVRNGTIFVHRALAGGDYIKFKKHDPDDLITKVAEVDYDRRASCPAFDEFFGYVQPEPGMRRFILQWLGYSLTADASEQRLVFFWGKGRNGKSTLMDTVAAIAGDYSRTVPIETFLAEGRGRSAGQASPDLAMLHRVRMVRASEPERNAKFGEALIKLVTGGEPIAVRHLNRDYFDLVMEGKLTISGNYRPQIGGTDEGIWRRVTLVPWAVMVPPERVDRNLPEKLKEEASGILNRLLAGLHDWLDNGLVLPEEVVNATAQYRQESDPLGRMLGVCVEASPGERVQASLFHQVFNAWAAANGERPWTATGLGRAMTERGFQRKQSNVNYWLDLRLVKTVDDFVDHEGKPRRQEDAGEDLAPSNADHGASERVQPYGGRYDDDDIPI